MKPELKKIPGIAPDQSVVLITGKNEIPEKISLSRAEREYALKQLEAGEGMVFINSYFKCTYIVRVKEGVSGFRAREEIRKSASSLKKLIRSNNHEELVITSEDTYREAVADFTEGLVLSIYSFRKYKTRTEDEESGKNYPGRLLLADHISESALKWLDDLTDAVYLARNLINEPVNRLNSAGLASEISRTGEKAGFSVEVFNKGKIESLKMGGLLSVNRGSTDPPAFCILEWKPENPVNSKPIVLVGKGVVYDTGGLNIKTGDYMSQMKADMAGAAAVTGVFYTIARNNIPLHLTGLIPVTDNRPGGNAYAPGDIITMYNKMTVEIGNTDAEGRLILADAISYASKYKPELIIDIATLTGSAAVTFGNRAMAMMTNADRKYGDLLVECGNEVYERVAGLPFYDEYNESIRSAVADVRNIGGREAGAITAGKFLERFAEFPIIHLDIAGTGILKKDDYYRIKDGPGSGVRLLSVFLKRLSETYNKIN
jgi:leucyl aminopeptidase